MKSEVMGFYQLTKTYGPMACPNGSPECRWPYGCAVCHSDARVNDWDLGSPYAYVGGVAHSVLDCRLPCPYFEPYCTDWNCERCEVLAASMNPNDFIGPLDPCYELPANWQGHTRSISS